MKAKQGSIKAAVLVLLNLLQLCSSFVPNQAFLLANTPSSEKGLQLTGAIAEPAFLLYLTAAANGWPRNKGHPDSPTADPAEILSFLATQKLRKVFPKITQNAKKIRKFCKHLFSVLNSFCSYPEPKFQVICIKELKILATKFR